MSQKEAVEAVKTGDGRVDLVTALSPLETLSVAQSRFAKVVKNRESAATVFGQFNTRKTGSAWTDVRLRQAANLAVNRDDVIRYAAKGNGVVIPALIPVRGLGFDPKLAPYPFDPARASRLLREAGYPGGLPVNLIAPQDLEALATVVGKMLEQAGFKVERQILGGAAFNQKIELGHLDQPAEEQRWDIALISWFDGDHSPFFSYYHYFAVDGNYQWITPKPELRQLYEQGLRTVDLEKQRGLLQQMERHTHAEAYFLFLYNAIKLYAVNRAVEFVPYQDTYLNFAETSVTDRHWSLRGAAPKP